MPILASSPNENKPTGDSSILLCSPETPRHDVAQKLVQRRPARRWLEDEKSETREGSHLSVIETILWRVAIERRISFRILVQNHPLSLHDYFPVMHYFAGSGLEYNTYYYYYYRPSSNCRRRAECKVEVGAEQRNCPLLFRPTPHCH